VGGPEREHLLVFGELRVGALPLALIALADVIMVGEIRDAETAHIAIEAAMTGHLVLSTLHTRDAPSALGRLIDMGIEPFLVSSAVDCIVAQRLVRELCKHCKRQQKVSEAVLAEHGLAGAEPYEPSLWRAFGPGCAAALRPGRAPAAHRAGADWRLD
jgi:type II secretory ATPase GspE/PulE/Tfp pilus assembly ATPase PilB-like protein